MTTHHATATTATARPIGPARKRCLLAAAGAGLALLASACGSSATENTNDPDPDALSADEDLVPEVQAVVADGGASDPAAHTGDRVPVRQHGSDQPDETTPTTAAAPSETTPPEPEPTPTPTPTTEPTSEPEVGPCGAFGPLPPRPDSMPTVLADTDEDGEIDDQITVYAHTGPWRIRVVEDGVTSEAEMPAIGGFARLLAVEDLGEGLTIAVEELESDRYYEFRFDADRCLQVVSEPAPGAIDDLVTPLPDPPAPDPTAPIDDLAVAGSCGVFAPIPDDALIGSDDMVDLFGDGGLHRVVAYSTDGLWRIRQIVHDTISEVEIPGAGAHGVRLIGQADVAAFGGRELLAVVGGDATSEEIAVFSSFEGPCMFRFQHVGGGDFSVFVGAGSYWGQGVTCEDGAIGVWGYQADEHDTFSTWGAVYEETTSGFYDYQPASDGYAEGIPASDLDDVLFDCDGLTL